MKRALIVLTLVLGLTAPAHAQLGAPGLPTVPDLGAPSVGDVTDRLPDVEGTVRELTNERLETTRDLLRRHRRVLEADPQGFPIVRSQIIALGMSEQAIAAAIAAGFQVVSRDDLGETGAMVTLRAPAGMATRRALETLRSRDPDGVYDFDHVHLESGSAFALPMAQSGVGPGPRIGLIDSGVSGAVAAQRAFASEAPVVTAHGTTVAALLLESAPNARLYAADIYGGAPTGGASSALARALTWLANEAVPVINVSLVGPRNRIVEAVVARLVARGFVIVAAVGNDGPAAPPLYPAAYAGVVGVTGVDNRARVLVEAGRGPHVDFSALGARAGPPRVRGTSYAAPTVAALIALQLSAPDPAAAARVLAALRASARDLGARGRDDVFGYGLIGPSVSSAAAR
ncbi:MAG: S8 family serine peptidase [Hyphomonadaceae bacterium]